MKLYELIENVDKSKSNEAHIGSDFFNDLDLESYYYNVNLEDHGFESYYLSAWNCTDTWVGLTVIFYNNEPIATTYQEARKSDTEIYWIGGQETALRIAKVIMELVTMRYIQVADLDLDMGNGFEVYYSAQLLNNRVIEKSTGEYVDVIKKYTDYKDIDQWCTVKIRDNNGIERTISLSDIIVPYRINKT